MSHPKTTINPIELEIIRASLLVAKKVAEGNGVETKPLDLIIKKLDFLKAEKQARDEYGIEPPQDEDDIERYH